MRNSNSGSKVVLFGAGGIGRIALRQMADSQRRVDYFVDNNPDLWGKEVEGIPVHSPDVLRRENADIFVTVGYKLYDDIRNQLSEMGLYENEDFYNFIKFFKTGWTNLGWHQGM